MHCRRPVSMEIIRTQEFKIARISLNYPNGAHSKFIYRGPGGIRTLDFWSRISSFAGLRALRLTPLSVLGYGPSFLGRLPAYLGCKLGNW